MNLQNLREKLNALQSATSDESAADVIGDTYMTVQMDPEKEPRPTVHTPVIDSVRTLFSEVLKDLDVVQSNIKKNAKGMPAVLEKVDAYDFSDGIEWKNNKDAVKESRRYGAKLQWDESLGDERMWLIVVKELMGIRYTVKNALHMLSDPQLMEFVEPSSVTTPSYRTEEAMVPPEPPKGGGTMAA